MLFYREQMLVLLKLILVGWFTTQLGHLERVRKIIGIALLIMMEVKSFGGSYAKVPLPIAGQNETRDEEGNITKYYYAVQTKIRNLFTDVSAVAADGSLTKISTSGTNLLKFQLPHQKELILLIVWLIQQVMF